MACLPCLPAPARARLGVPWRRLAGPGDVSRLPARVRLVLQTAPVMFAHSVIADGARKRPGLGILRIPTGPDSMTLPTQQQASRYRITACRSNSRRSISVGEKAVLRTAIENGREGLATAGLTSRINVPLPRVPVNARSTRNGVGRQARVDPSREARAYTAGPTRTVQNGPPRRLPIGAPRSETPGGRKVRADRAWAVRAADIPRPGARCSGVRGELCNVDLRTVENRPRPCLIDAC